MGQFNRITCEHNWHLYAYVMASGREYLIRLSNKRGESGGKFLIGTIPKYLSAYASFILFKMWIVFPIKLACGAWTMFWERNYGYTFSKLALSNLWVFFLTIMILKMGTLFTGNRNHHINFHKSAFYSLFSNQTRMVPILNINSSSIGTMFSLHPTQAIFLRCQE